MGALAGETNSSSVFEYCYALDQSCDTLIDGTGASNNCAFLSEDKMKDSTTDQSECLLSEWKEKGIW